MSSSKASTAQAANQEEDELRECQRNAQRNIKAQNNHFRPPSSMKQKTMLHEDFVPTKYSVVCGRTQNCYNHTG
jgi:hypothetical protein